MLRFYKGDILAKGRVGILPAAFNPPTLAHLELASESRSQHHLDQVVFLLPTVFPHKDYEGASFEQRLRLLADAAGDEETFAVASSEHGLFIDIVRAFRQAYGPAPEFFLLCGRDAAERIVTWDYRSGPAFGEQLDEFQLLVGSRRGEYQAAAALARRIHPVIMPPATQDISASAVRAAIAAGEDWERWVPRAVARRIRKENLYGGGEETLSQRSAVGRK